MQAAAQRTAHQPQTRHDRPRPCPPLLREAMPAPPPQEVEQILDGFWSAHRAPAPREVLGDILATALRIDGTRAVERALEAGALVEVDGGLGPRCLSKRATAAHVLLGAPAGLSARALVAELEAAALTRATGRRAWSKAIYDNPWLWLDAGSEGGRPVWRHVRTFPWSEARCRAVLAQVREALPATGRVQLATLSRDLSLPLFALRHAARWYGGEEGVYVLPTPFPHRAELTADPADLPMQADHLVLRVLKLCAEPLTVRELTEALDGRFAAQGVRAAVRRLRAQGRVTAAAGRRYALT